MDDHHYHTYYPDLLGAGNDRKNNIRIPVCQEADSRMKEHVDRLFGKLRSSKGETLAELLVSVLVIVLGLTMFATE